MLAIRKLAGPQALEQVQVFLNAAVPIRAVFSRLGQRATVVTHVLGAKAVNICAAQFD